MKKRKIKLVDYKIVKGTYLLGTGREQNSYEFKIFKGHPDFEKIQVDSICWSFYQTADVITTIPALIRVEKIYQNQEAIKINNQLEYKNGYPLILIAKVLENFDYRLLEYIYATNTRYESEVSRFNMIEEKQNVTIPPIELNEKYKLYREIKKMKQEGMSMRAIAKNKGISRNTVAKYLNSAPSDFIKLSRKTQLSEYREYILSCLYKDSQISAKKMFDQLEKNKKGELNFGKRAFEKYVRYLREKHKIKK